MSQPFPFCSDPAVFTEDSHGSSPRDWPASSLANAEGEFAVKEQLEKLVLQMYRSGIRYSESVREFQSVSFLPYCESKERIRLGLRRNWGCTATPCGALFGISNSTSGRYVLP